MSKAKYTLITGASEGLGKALALECATRNHNLILVALPDSGLTELGEFICRNFNVEVFTFEEDLTEEESCKQLYAQIVKLNLAVNMLINNAGLESTMSFAEGSIELYAKQIKLNVLATTLLCRLFINDLIINGPSYIMNVSSMASFFYLPKKLVYSCTKSFILHFSQSLQCEVDKHNVSVSKLCPPGLNTNVSVTLLNKSGTFLSRVLVMNPEDVAPLAIEAMLKGKQIILPGPLSKLYKWVGKVLPRNVQRRIAMYNMNRVEIKPQYLL
jgi:short-subunit dehydrogenase